MVYKAAKMPTRALFDEAMEEIKTRYPTNYQFLMSKPLGTWTHHAAPKDLVLLDTTTSNNAESTIAMIGREVGSEVYVPGVCIWVCAYAGEGLCCPLPGAYCTLRLPTFLEGEVPFFAQATCHQ